MNIQHSLTIALTKGRILDETLPLLAAVGIEPNEDLESSRKLIISTTVSSIQLVVLRGSDVQVLESHLLVPSAYYLGEFETVNKRAVTLTADEKGCAST